MCSQSPEISPTVLSLDNHHPSKPSAVRNVESSIVLWFNPRFDQSDVHYRESLTELRNTINSIGTFKDADACIDFITDVEDEKVFLIISSLLVQSVVPVVENVSQVDSIYILDTENQFQCEVNINKWRKVKGMFTAMNQLSKSLKRDIRLCEYNMTSISIMRAFDSPEPDPNVLDPSFMFSQLLKDILLCTEYDAMDKKKLVDFCRLQYHDSVSELKVIDQFDRDYNKNSSIWWYTRECFTYHMLNRALRTQDVEVIIHMGFVLRDIDEQLRSLQVEASINSIPSIVYRGQGMNKIETEKLKANKGGLLALNSFVSTSPDRQFSFAFASSAAQNPDLNGILFRITIDPSINSTPFASMKGRRRDTFLNASSISHWRYGTARLSGVTSGFDLNKR